MTENWRFKAFLKGLGIGICKKTASHLLRRFILPPPTPVVRFRELSKEMDSGLISHLLQLIAEVIYPLLDGEEQIEQGQC